MTTGRRIAISAGAAVVSIGGAVAVNYATASQAQPWSWVAVAIIMLLAFASTFIQQSGSNNSSEPTSSQRQRTGSNSLAIQSGRDTKIDQIDQSSPGDDTTNP